MNKPGLCSREVAFNIRWWTRWVPLILLCCLLAAPSRAQAQASTLKLEIVSPGEGETFYAGPSSLLYSMKVKGYLSAPQTNQDLTQVDLTLEIWLVGQIVDELHTHADTDGYFTYSLAVNPDGSTAVFPPEYQPFCETCHFSSDHGLPAGQVSLRVIASSPSGTSITAERHIVVDRSSMMSLQVRVVLADNPQQGVANIPISVSTRLYQWRGRSFLGTSNEQGLAVVPLEHLAAAPTHYIARVEPVLVDGVRYASTGTAEALLNPASTDTPLLTLKLTAERGSIQAQVNDAQGQPIDGFPLKLVHLPDGTILKTVISQQGAYQLDDLPIERYLLVAGGAAADGEEWAFNSNTVDLTSDLHGQVHLVASAIENGLQGIITGADQLPLPFAWAQSEKGEVVQAADPASGSFNLTGLPPQRDTLLLSAPGYYTQAVVQIVGSSQSVTTLKLRPDTVRIPWGEGAILVPAESKVERDASHLTLQSGWLSGAGSGPLPVSLSAGDLQIQVKDGRFALEYLPEKSAWFFMFSGEASLTQTGSVAPVQMTGGQMLRFDVDSPVLPAPYDQPVVSALRPLNYEVISPAWEPSIAARLRDSLARMGIGVAQIVTYISYLGILAAILVLPLFSVLRLRGKASQHAAENLENKEIN